MSSILEKKLIVTETTTNNVIIRVDTLENLKQNIVKRYSTGKIERISRLNKMPRKLTPTEIVLYGKG